MRGADVPLYRVGAGGRRRGRGGQPGGTRRAASRAIASSASTAATCRPGTRSTSRLLPKANRELAVDIDRRRRAARRSRSRRRRTASTSSAISASAGACGRSRAMFSPGGRPSAPGFQRGDVVLGRRRPARDRSAGDHRLIKKSAGKPLTFTIERDGEAQDIAVVPDRAAASSASRSARRSAARRSDAASGVRLSAQQNWDSTQAIGQTLQGLSRGETPVKQLMGPVAIAELSGSAAQLGLADAASA